MCRFVIMKEGAATVAGCVDERANLKATGLPAAPGIYLSGVALVAFSAGFASKRTGGHIRSSQAVAPASIVIGV
jgi:hypothetical protein